MGTLPPNSVIAAEKIPGSPILQATKPDPCAGVISGLTGDLAKRKLIPSAYNRLVDRALPELFPIILKNLSHAGIIYRANPDSPRPFSRVVIEKPFGSDLASARALNHLVAECLDESQTFRIDHYLGKETVQNILVFRYANAI